MIEITKGDILKANAEALVNTVNCVGVMGRGIALQFRKAFPRNYKSYESACKRQEVQPGRMFVYDSGSMVNPRYIINFPTKRDWRSKSKMEDIDAGLVALVEEIRARNIRSIAIPPLGCGLGGLKWQDVLPRIQRAFESLDNQVDVFIYAPDGAPAAEHIVKEENAPKMTVGRAALVGLMRRYLSAVMDPTVTLLELQKLMYFMQESGQALQLRYEKGHYGPYAKNLGNVLNVIEGHFISGYRDGGDDPRKPLELKSEAIEKAEEYLQEHKVTFDRFERVTLLIQGFETPYGMELLSTVHWVAKNMDTADLNKTVKEVHSWSPRKRMFEAEHIEVALNMLQHQGWLSSNKHSKI